MTADETLRPCWTIDGFKECPEYIALHADWDRLQHENADMREAFDDLLRNVAGMDDGNLFVSSHAVLVAAVREWREEARNILNHTPKGQRT